MSTNVEIPALGESVSEAVLLRWLKNEGDSVNEGDSIAELETDKANVDLPAKTGGVLRQLKAPGDTVQVGETVARIDPAGSGAGASGAGAKAPPGKNAPGPAMQPQPAARSGAAQPALQPQGAPIKDTGKAASIPSGGGHAAPGTAAPSLAPSGRSEDLSPAVRRMVEENKLDPASIPATGPGGRITKEDAQKYMDSRGAPAGRAAPEEHDDGDGEPSRAMPPRPGTASSPRAASPGTGAVPASSTSQPPSPASFDATGEKRVPMSKIRKKIAERLVHAQQTAAILTTFNEVDLHNLQEIRGRYKEKFEKLHGVGLGLMS